MKIQIVTFNYFRLLKTRFVVNLEKYFDFPEQSHLRKLLVNPKYIFVIEEQ